jgi:UDP:flavonoid glycosyltransferase YjiC (YdhE family)
MHDALDRLLTDARLRSRLAASATTIQQHDGVRKAADLIEQNAET